VVGEGLVGPASPGQLPEAYANELSCQGKPSSPPGVQGLHRPDWRADADGAAHRLGVAAQEPVRWNIGLSPVAAIAAPRPPDAFFDGMWQHAPTA
jgi:hypothetical protein